MSLYFPLSVIYVYIVQTVLIIVFPVPDRYSVFHSEYYFIYSVIIYIVIYYAVSFSVSLFLLKLSDRLSSSSE